MLLEQDQLSLSRNPLAADEAPGIGEPTPVNAVPYTFEPCNLFIADPALNDVVEHRAARSRDLAQQFPFIGAEVGLLKPLGILDEWLSQPIGVTALHNV